MRMVNLQNALSKNSLVFKLIMIKAIQQNEWLFFMNIFSTFKL